MTLTRVSLVVYANNSLGYTCCWSLISDIILLKTYFVQLVLQSYKNWLVGNIGLATHRSASQKRWASTCDPGSFFQFTVSRCLRLLQTQVLLVCWHFFGCWFCIHFLWHQYCFFLVALPNPIETYVIAKCFIWAKSFMSCKFWKHRHMPEKTSFLPIPCFRGSNLATFSVDPAW